MLSCLFLHPGLLHAPCSRPCHFSCSWQPCCHASAYILVSSMPHAASVASTHNELFAQLGYHQKAVYLRPCRLALLLLTAHTLPPGARPVVTSMVLQALLRPHSSSPTEGSAQQPGLLDCAALALLLNLLHYLLLQASQPPPPELLQEVDALLKVSLQYSCTCLSRSTVACLQLLCTALPS